MKNYHSVPGIKMTTKLKIIFTGIILTIVTLFIYFSLRIDILENTYTDSLIKKTEHITNLYKKTNHKNKARLTDFFNKINAKFDNIALIGAAHNNFSLKLSSKNNKFIRTNSLYESIINDFNSSNFSNNKPNFIIRYYSSTDKNRKTQKKFYIFHKKINKDRLLIAFAYKPGIKLIIRIVLEISLIIIFYIILTTSLYLLLLKNGHIKTASEYIPLKAENKKMKPESPDKKIVLSKENTTIEQEKKFRDKKNSSAYSDLLNRYVFELFREIYAAEKPLSISLFLKYDENKLSKTYELRGKSFIKIDSLDFEVILINNEIGKELKKSLPLILKNNTELLIPVTHENQLIAAARLLREKPFDGKDVNLLRQTLSEAAEKLNDYIVVNNVMIDKNTGLHSKTSFDMKYNEHLKKAKEKTETVGGVKRKKSRRNKR